LRGRFREIIVTLDSPATLPAGLPPNWLLPDASGAVARFIESRFDEQQTGDQIRRLFPQMKDLAVNPMPLRTIFVTLAKNNQMRKFRP
jgi:ABC-2 type transport system ATP-binding protein